MKQKYFVLIFLNFLLTGSVFSQVDFVNIGEVTNDGTMSVVGNFLNSATGTYTNSGNLFVQGDYMNDGTIDPSTGTTTFNQRDTSPSETIQNIYGTSAFEFYNLVVNNNTSLGVLVADGIGLFVENDLYLQEGNLRLEGESQLIQTKSGVDTNTPGTGVLLRDQQGIASTYGYNYWSSPVNNGSGSYSLDNVLFDGTDSSVNPFSPTPIQYTIGSQGNGSPSIVDGSGNVTTAATVNSLALFSFLNETIDDTEGWVGMNEFTLRLPGEGYTMKGTNTLDANQNYTFKGQPNNGDYSHSINGGKSSLLGNPYPSAYDIDALIIKTSYVGAVYFWVDGGSTNHIEGDYLGGYATRSVTGGVGASTAATEVPGTGGLGDADSKGGPGQYLAVGQGFFIENIIPFAAAITTVNFINEDRSFVKESDGDSKFFKDSKKENELAQEQDLSKQSDIRIGYEDPEGFHRQILLAFIPGSVADLDYNENYDALVNGPREDDLFFVIENEPAKQYVIQGVGAYNEDVVFPLSLTISEEGIHTIMLDAVENFESDVYIYDKVEDVTYNLSEESFSPNLSIGQYNNRFEIVFKQQASLGTDDEIISNFNVHFDGDQNLVVRNKNNLAINKLSVFNTLGQQLLVINNNKLEQSQTIIPFSYQMGVYIIVVETNEGKETFRIINK